MEKKIKEFLTRFNDFYNLSQKDQIIALAYVYTQKNKSKKFSIKDIDNMFDLAGVHKPSNTRTMLNYLSQKKFKIFIKEGDKYSFHHIKLNELSSVIKNNPEKININKNLDSLLIKIQDLNSRSFLKEALDCLSVGANRATLIMVWILTINRLQEYIISDITRLNNFNIEWIKMNNKNKRVTDIRGFSDIKEERFIELCRSSGVIDNNERKILEEKLGIRNTASHPNSIKIKDSKVIDFVEDLIENILIKFV